MKYYSEKLDKLFDSIEECQKAEDKEVGAKDGIEDLMERLDQAHDNYNAATATLKDKIAELELCNKKILEPLEKKVTEAELEIEKIEKFIHKGISDYVKEYGPYTITMESDKAEKEFQRITKLFNF